MLSMGSDQWIYDVGRARARECVREHTQSVSHQRIDQRLSDDDHTRTDLVGRAPRVYIKHIYRCCRSLRDSIRVKELGATGNGET